MDPRLAALDRSQAFAMGQLWEQFASDKPDIEFELTDCDLTPERDAQWTEFSKSLTDHQDAQRAELVDTIKAEVTVDFDPMTAQF